MKRPEKEAVVAQLTDKFRNADAIYLTEYRGLTVPQISELREKLGRDTSYTVAKNTLVRIAAKEAGIEGLDELLAGISAHGGAGHRLPGVDNPPLQQGRLQPLVA